LVVLALCLVAILAGDALALAIHQTVTPVTAGSALRAYHQHHVSPSSQGVAPGSTDTSTPPTAAAPRVESNAATARSTKSTKQGEVRSSTQTSEPVQASGEGVYVYDTSGGEEIDPPAFGRQAHTYPATSTITVQRDGCGTTSTWKPLEERFDRWSTCRESSRVLLRRVTEHFEFFNQTDEETYVCSPDSVDFVLAATGGATYQAGCTSGGSNNTKASRFDVTGKVQGVENIAVGGVTVHAVHVVERIVASGGTTGETKRERWFDLATGLLVRLESVSTARSTTPIGDVPYEEHVSLALTSLTPQT
jgi:hypothetical protein